MAEVAFCHPQSCPTCIASRQEIIVQIGRKIVRRRGLAAERFAVTNLLDIAKAAGDAAIAVGIESVEVDRHSGVAAGIHLGAVEDRLNAAIHDLRRGGAVGVHEEAVLVGFIVTLGIAVTERELIDKLAEASQAGVRVDLIVRGICCLVPGVPGKTDHITVTSIVGEFLEHSRIYAFCNADGPQIGEGPASGPEVYIGSADLMHRNLDRRVEALVRVTAPEQIDELIKYVDLQMADSTMSWHMQPDGTYVLHTKDDEGRPLVDSQEYLIRKHQRRPNSHN